MAGAGERLGPNGDKLAVGLLDNSAEAAFLDHVTRLAGGGGFIVVGDEAGDVRALNVWVGQVGSDGRVVEVARPALLVDQALDVGSIALRGVYTSAALGP